MGYLLRIVKAGQFSGREAWQSASDVQDHVVRFFRDEKDDLSIFRIDDEIEVERTIAAFAAAHPKKIKSQGALYIEESLVDWQNLRVRKTDGRLPCPAVSSWHLSVSALSDPESARLAYVFGTGGTLRDFPRDEVCKLIVASIDAGHFGLSALSDGVANDVRKFRLR